jgi:uncharacterized protein YfaS (alpha-2-macroglobulin family)
MVRFDMPQFNGTVRVNAVAWSRKGLGHASQDVIVRDPVVISASLPQFLAPGDRSQMLVELANTDGPAGVSTSLRCSRPRAVSAPGWTHVARSNF